MPWAALITCQERYLIQHFALSSASSLCTLAAVRQFQIARSAIARFADHATAEAAPGAVMLVANPQPVPKADLGFAETEVRKRDRRDAGQCILRIVMQVLRRCPLPAPSHMFPITKARSRRAGERVNGRLRITLTVCFSVRPYGSRFLIIIKFCLQGAQHDEHHQTAVVGTMQVQDIKDLLGQTGMHIRVPLTREEARLTPVKEAMKHAAWIHLACHGVVVSL